MCVRNSTAPPTGNPVSTGQDKSVQIKSDQGKSVQVK